MSLLSPILAETIAASGWTKAQLQQALFDRARIPASRFEEYIGHWTNLVPGQRKLGDFVNLKVADAQFAESQDPERMLTASSADVDLSAGDRPGWTAAAQIWSRTSEAYSATENTA